MLKKLALGLALLTLALGAQAATSYQEGEQYKKLDVPIPTANPDKIEVREFFFYGCPHCYHALPLVDAWLKTIPDDVNFELNPVLFMNGAENLAEAFFIAKNKGILDKTHDALFNAIQGVERNQPLFEQDNLAEWFTQYGVPFVAYKGLAESFTVQSQIKQAKALTRAAGIRGVPAFLVDGQYLVLRRNLPDEHATFKVINYLVDMVRQQRAAADNG